MTAPTTKLITEGLQYKRMDLHVHTTGSEDFQDRGVTADQIVRAAIDAGLDAIAVTDHNNGAMIDAVKAAAEGTNLTVFPGVEITIQQVHLIALLDVDKTSAHVSDLLTSLEINIDEQGKIEALSPTTVVKAAEIITKHGGLPILGHVNADKGVMRAITGKSRTLIMKDSLIAAAEVTDFDVNGASTTAKALWGRTAEFGNRKLATYQSSDNPAGIATHGHGLQGIGKRASFFKLDIIDLHGLKQCFLDPEVRIVQTLDSKIHAHITGVKVTGGYFDGESADLHNGLNTLIGGKGAGKSLLIELLRFVLNKIPDVPEVRDDHDLKLEHQLKMYSQVEISFTDETGASHTVVRNYNPQAGHPYENEAQQLAADNFPVLFLSQNEIISIAQDPDAQLTFIDQFFNFQHHASAIAELERKIGEYDVQLAAVINAMRSSLSVQKDLTNTTSQITHIDSQLRSKIFDDYSNAEVKMKTLEAQRQQLVDATSQLDDISKKDVFKAQTLPAGFETDPALLRSKDAVDKAVNAITAEITSQKATLTAAVGVIDKEIAGYQSVYEGKRTTYQIHVRTTGGTKQALARKRAELVLKQKGEVEKLAALKLISDERISVNDKRNALHSDLQTAHEEYTAARVKKFAVLQTKSASRLKLTLFPGENKDLFKKRLLDLKRGSYMKDAEIIEMCNKVDPASFVRMIMNYIVTNKTSHIDDFAVKYNISSSNLRQLVNFLTVSMELNDLLKLQYEAQPQDRPEIEYNTGTKGAPNYRPLSQLSTGQKCTALLVIALCDGNMPVVIDQPEDSLDIKTVWEDMCLKVRTGKSSRQFVFTTHNSSLAVASDSDKFLVISGSADAGEIVMIGSMDNEEMRKEVIKHLEGDVDAYKKKYVKYVLKDMDYTA